MNRRGFLARLLALPFAAAAAPAVAPLVAEKVKLLAANDTMGAIAIRKITYQGILSDDFLADWNWSATNLFKDYMDYSFEFLGEPDFSKDTIKYMLKYEAE